MIHSILLISHQPWKIAVKYRALDTVWAGLCAICSPCVPTRVWKIWQTLMMLRCGMITGLLCGPLVGDTMSCSIEEMPLTSPKQARLIKRKTRQVVLAIALIQFPPKMTKDGEPRDKSI